MKQYWNSLIANDITSKGASLLLNTLKNNKVSIQTFWLSNARLNDDFFQVFGEYVKEMESLVDVDIGFNDISDSGLKALIPYIDGNRSLKKLILNGNKAITNASFSTFVKMIEVSSIVELDAKFTSFDKSKDISFLLALNCVKYGSTKLELFSKNLSDDDIQNLCEYVITYGASSLQEIK